MGRRGKCGRFEPNVCFLYSSLGIQRFLHWFWQRFLPLNEKQDPLVCWLSAAFDTKTEFALLVIIEGGARSSSPSRQRISHWVMPRLHARRG